MKPNIGLTEKNSHKSILILTQLLADEMVLYTKYRKCHWNVYGESFMELHRLFQEHYTALETTIDDIAERINKLGGKSIGTMQEFLKIARLTESPKLYGTQKDMLKLLLTDNETLTQLIRSTILASDKEPNDLGTTDYLTKLLQDHEQYAWVLRRYLS